MFAVAIVLSTLAWESGCSREQSAPDVAVDQEPADRLANCDNVLDVTWEKMDLPQKEACCPPEEGWLKRLDDHPVCTNKEIIMRIHNKGSSTMSLPRDLAYHYIFDDPEKPNGCIVVGSAFISPRPYFKVDPGRFFEIKLRFDLPFHHHCLSYQDICLEKWPEGKLLDLKVFQGTLDKPFTVIWTGEDICPDVKPIVHEIDPDDWGI